MGKSGCTTFLGGWAMALLRGVWGQREPIRIARGGAANPECPHDPLRAPRSARPAFERSDHGLQTVIGRLELSSQPPDHLLLDGHCRRRAPHLSPSLNQGPDILRAPRRSTRTKLHRLRITATRNPRPP